MEKTIIEKLKAPLPIEAVSQHPTKPYLSTIKAIYVVERLNEVFGLGGWKVENEVIVGHPSKMIVVKSRFSAQEIYVEAFGGNDNTDLGDAYKGACTDALTKIGSYLYVGMDVFKGLATEFKAPKSQAPTIKTATPDVDAPACLCGKPSKRLQVKKEGSNKGRYFYACSSPKDQQCDFFKFEDEITGSEVFDDKFKRVIPDDGGDHRQLDVERDEFNARNAEQTGDGENWI